MSEPSASPPSPLVSVLMPSYNHATYIESALDSLLADGHQPLELVLMDDGSSDDTYAVAVRWAERNRGALLGGIQMDRHVNQGVVRTLNRLFQQARGDYFVLLASDDRLLPGGIAARLAHLARHPEHLAVFGDAWGMALNGEHRCNSVLEHHQVSRAALRCERTRALEIIIKWSIPGPVLMLRRAVIDRIGLYDERYRLEDRAYYLRLLAAKALGYIDRPVAVYRLPERLPAARYEARQHDLERIAAELVGQFPPLQRWALAAVAGRGRRQHSSRIRDRFGQALLDGLLRRLRRLNRLAAWCCGSGRAAGPQAG